ncbi:MAG: hypothetical protein K2Q26_04615 [Bdellovibrionales bacterium]|nr:hypothetical protein [Bdellovibrionales bacterium]
MEVQLFLVNNEESSKPKNHRDLGFTDDEFLEIVDFFQELMRLDQKGKQKVRLVQVLRGRLQQLAHERRKVLLDELSGLEKH